MESSDNGSDFSLRQHFPAKFNCIDNSCMAASWKQDGIEKQSLFVVNGIGKRSVFILEKIPTAVFPGYSGNRARQKEIWQRFRKHYNRPGKLPIESSHAL